MKDKIESGNRRNWRQFSLVDLFWFATMIAVLWGWQIDRQNLQSQIKPTENKMTMSHVLHNASPSRVVSELTKLYPEQRFVAGTQKYKSVVYTCDASLWSQIQIIIHHFDRINTNMLETETNAGKPIDSQRK